MIIIKLIAALIALIGCVWMMMNLDNYVDATHTLIEDTLSYEDWKEELQKCTTQEQCANWYLERPIDSHKAKHAFYDKMQALEDINKIHSEVLSLN